MWKRGPGALPGAAAAALATGAPAVHVQHELFLYGGPAAVPGHRAGAGRAAAAATRCVTMHHVVDPQTVDADFTATHRVRAPAPVARAGVAAVQRTIAALADTVVVHEPLFAHVVPGAEIVPHGVEIPERGDRAERARRARRRWLLRALLRVPRALQGARGRARRRPARGRGRRARRSPAASIRGCAGDGYADALRAAAPTNARFTGYVADVDVARWFAAADVALLPYPQPFASSGPLALALAHGTPVLLSDAPRGHRRRAGRARRPDRPGGHRCPPRRARCRPRRSRAAARCRRDARRRPQLARGRPPPSRSLRESWMTAVAPLPPTPRSRTGRVFLVGAFGQGNPGDEALLAAFAERDRLPPRRRRLRRPGRHHRRARARRRGTRRPRPRRARDPPRGRRSSSPAARSSRRSIPRPGARRSRSCAARPRSPRSPARCASRSRWSASAPRRCTARRARGLARAIVRAADLLILRDEESAAHLADDRRADADPRRRRRRLDAAAAAR